MSGLNWVGGDGLCVCVCVCCIHMVLMGFRFSMEQDSLDGIVMYIHSNKTIMLRQPASQPAIVLLITLHMYSFTTLFCNELVVSSFSAPRKAIYIILYTNFSRPLITIVIAQTQRIIVIETTLSNRMVP